MKGKQRFQQSSLSTLRSRPPTARANLVDSNTQMVFAHSPKNCFGPIARANVGGHKNEVGLAGRERNFKIPRNITRD
jgi:hypothetical protein